MLRGLTYLWNLQQNKQNRKEILDIENIFTVARQEGGLGDWVKRLRDKEIQIGSLKK